jgi:23S rRNA (guanosine2251-2'-O)-methyltransferase
MKPPRKPYSGGPKKPPQGRDGARGFGPRPSTPRPVSSRPASSRPQGDRPRSDRPGDDRPREDRPREDRPRGDRPREGRPQGNTLVLAPRAEAPRPERPRTERPHTERPHTERPRDDVPHAPKHFSPKRPPRPQPAPEERGEDTPRGSLWLFGTHAVAAALANPARRLRRLLLTEEAEAELAGKLKQPWAMQPERCDRARLEQLLGRGIVHQGAALLADPLAMPSLAQALERPGPVLVLDQVSDPRNVGAIIRSAAAFGVACVITQDRNAPDETGTLAKAASGALETLPMLRAVNIARTLVALRAAGLWVIGLDASGPPISGPALVNRRVALVLGSEGEGLRRLTKETCDEVAGIAMPGGSLRLDSLNVSAAAAVALYEMSRK